MFPDRLAQILKSGQVPHALLFSGPKGARKKQTALTFAADLLATKKKPENHPDIHHFYPEGKTGMHPLSAIRKLAQDAALAPFEGTWKIFIIYEAEKMLPTSSNALLKTLEEPSPHTLIILLSAHPDRLLPTILSRCQIVEFPPAVKNKGDEQTLNLLAELSEKYSRESHTKFESEDPDSVFETILFWYRDRLLLEIGGGEELLHFPEHLSHIKKTPFIPLEEVEKGVIQARLAHERSTKLSICLEMLFLSFQIY